MMGGGMGHRTDGQPSRVVPRSRLAAMATAPWFLATITVIAFAAFSVDTVGPLRGTAAGTDLVPAVAVSGGGQRPAWRTTKDPLPANANKHLESTINATACPAAGSCVAVGNYRTGSGGDSLGLIETLSGGMWIPTQAPLPADAGPEVILNDIACSTVGSCVAVGNYFDTGNASHGLIEALSGGTWTPIEAPLPANAATNSGVNLKSLACPDVGDCVAIGNYGDGSGFGQGLLETLSAGTWTATEAPLPANALPNGGIVSAVACETASTCVVIGNYTVMGGGEGLIETLSGGTWTSTEVPLPTQGASGNLLDVTCPDVADCVAVGNYSDQGHNAHVLVDTLSAGTWTPTEARLPAGAQPSGNLLSVSCADAADCEAVGGYIDTAGNPQGLIETLSGGTWTAGAAPVPPNAESGSGHRYLSLVACSAVGFCAAGGGYTDTTAVDQTLLETLLAGKWIPTEASIPGNRTGTAVVNDVSCPAPDSCVSVGNYNDLMGFGRGVIETLVGTSPTISSPDRATFVDGQAGTFTVTATGSPVPSITERDKLPKGLRFTGGKSTASISGTPAPRTAGHYLVTIEASNGLGPKATQYLTVTIKR